MIRILPIGQEHVKHNLAQWSVAHSAKCEHHPAMQTESRKPAPKNRIRAVRQKKQMTLAELSEKSGFSQSYLSRLEASQRQVSIKTLNAIAEALLVPQSELLELNPLTGRAVLKSHVQAGEFAEDFEWPESDWREVDVADDPRYAGIEKHACEVRGESMNLVYPPGTVLIWVSLFDDGETLKPGKRYIVRRESEDGGKYEMTVKTYKLDDMGRKWLVPESSSPEFQAPVELKVQKGKAVVEVLGRVVQHIGFD